MISFNIRGLEEVQDFLRKLPRGGARVALKAIVEYVIGDASHGLKHPDPYKYVSRKSAYGQTFFTAKQRRWFFANKIYEKIGNNRTGNSTDAWQYQMVSDWNIKINNPETGAYYTRDDKGQARQPGKVGWRKTTKVVMDNMKGAILRANQAVARFINSNGK